MFYEKEVFLGSLCDAVPMLSILSRCCVLSVSEYLSLRPLDMSDGDVYVCESRYVAEERAFVKTVSLAPIAAPPTLPPRETVVCQGSVELRKVVSPHISRASASVPEVLICLLCKYIYIYIWSSS